MAVSIVLFLLIWLQSSSPLWGKISTFWLAHIFQMAWNHHLWSVFDIIFNTLDALLFQIPPRKLTWEWKIHHLKVFPNEHGHFSSQSCLFSGVYLLQSQFPVKNWFLSRQKSESCSPWIGVITFTAFFCLLYVCTWAMKKTWVGCLI